MMSISLWFNILLALTFGLSLQTKAREVIHDGGITAHVNTKISQMQDCKVNICFAIDGSGSLSKQDFDNQISFALGLVGLTLGTIPAEFAGVQFGRSVQPIASLSKDVAGFLQKILSATQLRDNMTHIAAGINYCADELYSRKEELNGIVLLTDGRENLGKAVNAANRFRDGGGTLYVVNTDSTLNAGLTAISGGVGVIGDTSSFTSALSVFSLLQDACKA